MAAPMGKAEDALSKRAQKRREWWEKYKEKNKITTEEGGGQMSTADDVELDTDSQSQQETRTRHQSKSKKISTPLKNTNTDSEVEESADTSETETDKPSSEADSKSGEKKKKKRRKKKKYYVLFVGNLPYGITKEELQAHFKRTGNIKDIRLLTDRDTGKSRGCAYVEFEDEKSHLFALRLHHSELAGRRINVEFTSAGRKTDIREKRLQEKNKTASRFKMPRDAGNKPRRGRRRKQ